MAELDQSKACRELRLAKKRKLLLLLNRRGGQPPTPPAPALMPPPPDWPPAEDLSEMAWNYVFGQGAERGEEAREEEETHEEVEHDELRKLRR